MKPSLTFGVSILFMLLCLLGLAKANQHIEQRLATSESRLRSAEANFKSLEKALIDGHYIQVVDPNESATRKAKDVAEYVRGNLTPKPTEEELREEFFRRTRIGLPLPEKR